MTKNCALQLGLITEPDVDYLPVGDWDYDELGTNTCLVPNSPSGKLGSSEILDPNFPDPDLGSSEISDPKFPDPDLGSEILSDPKFPDWKPPFGNLELKPINDRQYWYWRYYDAKGKKRSLYLHKDYNKAVLKAMTIGVPSDAKCLPVSTSQTHPQTETPTQLHPLHIAPTAHGTSRAA